MIERLIRTQTIKYVVWDGKDKTLECINTDLLSELNNSNISVGRCYNENTEANDLNTLFISKEHQGYTSNEFHEIGSYIVLDFNPLSTYGVPQIEYFLMGYSKEQFEKIYSSLLLKKMLNSGATGTLRKNIKK